MNTTPLFSHRIAGLTCLLSVCLLLLSFSLHGSWAAESVPAKTAQPVPTANGTQKLPGTPVIVDLQGTDTLGAKLALQMKESINASSLLHLTAHDEPKIQILLSTVPEFTSRPGIGSAYSVVWLYYEGPKSFTSYLGGEVGIITPEDIPNLATRLMEKTTGLAVRYSYIFNQ